MSGDSLGAAPFEEDSLEEEAVMDRREEALWNCTTLTERQEDSETDKEEELSDTMMQVMFLERCVCLGKDLGLGSLTGSHLSERFHTPALKPNLAG